MNKCKNNIQDEASFVNRPKNNSVLFIILIHNTVFHFFTFRFIVQVYPDGIRHIRADKRVNEWKAPGKKTIMKCAVNQRQVVIALSAGELVYFEMDSVRFSQSSAFILHTSCGFCNSIT